MLEMLVDQDVAKRDALGFEQVEHFLLRNLVVFKRVGVGAEAVLVTDNDEFITGILQFEQRRYHAPHQFQFFQ